jgi:hypothetical protein
MARRESMATFERRLAQRDALNKAEAAGEVVDSKSVRMELVRKMRAGEMTLEEVQAELRRIQRNAKREGRKTRDQFFRSGN